MVAKVYNKPVNALFKKLSFTHQPAILVTNAPASFLPALDDMAPLATVHTTFTGVTAATFVMTFATTQVEVDGFAAQIATVTSGDAVVWIAYPKGSSKKYKCEFNRDNGWAAMGAHGFEPVRMVAIDEDWSALRFRRVEFIQTMQRQSRHLRSREKADCEAPKKPVTRVLRLYLPRFQSLAIFPCQ